MPQIKEYRQQTRAPGPAEYSMVKGSDFSGGMGNNIAALGETVSQVNDVFAKREKQDQEFQVQKTAMKEQLDLNEYMQQLKQKAPAGGVGFTETAKTELDKRKNAILDAAPSEFMRKNLDLDISKIHMGALNESIQYEAESKAKKDKNDVMVLSDRAKNAVRLNPATVNAALEAQNKLIDSTSLDETNKTIWKQKALGDLRESEVRGWIDINPYKAKEFIEKGTWDNDLTSDLRQSLLHESNQGIRALEVERNRTKRLDDDVKDAKREAIKDDFISRAATGNASAIEIARNPDLTSVDKEHLIRAVNTGALNTAKASNPSLFNNVVERINLPDGDPRKITSDAQILPLLGKGLSFSDITHARKELAGSGTDEGKQDKVFTKGLDDIAKGMLTKSNGMGFKDPEGDTQLQKWRIFAAKEVAAGKTKGLTVADMMDPDSKNYVGRHLKNFQRSQEQVMNSVFSSMKPPGGAVIPAKNVAPRGANESASDYLKRTK